MYRRCVIISIIAVLGLGPCHYSIAAMDSDTESDWRPSPTGAALRSLVFPGWGQIYARQPLKAVIYSGIEQGFIYGVYRQHKLYQYYESRDNKRLADVYKNDRNRMAWYLAAAIILSVMDAFVDAHLYGFDVSNKLSYMHEERGFSGSCVTVGFTWRVP